MDSSAEIAAKSVGGAQSLFYFFFGRRVKEPLRVRITLGAPRGEIPCGIVGNQRLNEVLNPALFFCCFLGRPLVFPPRHPHQKPCRQDSGDTELNRDRPDKPRSGAKNSFKHSSSAIRFILQFKLYAGHMLHSISHSLGWQVSFPKSSSLDFYIQVHFQAWYDWDVLWSPGIYRLLTAHKV